MGSCSLLVPGTDGVIYALVQIIGIEILTAMELDSEVATVTELEALLGPFDVLLGPFDALLGTFELPGSVEVDALSEEDTKVLEGLEVGKSEDPDSVLWDEGSETEGPDGTEGDSEPLLLNIASELDPDELTAAEEAELSVVKRDSDALPEDEAESTLLSKLDCELGSKLELPVADAELPVAETDKLVPGLVLRLGTLREPEPEADPEAETGDVPLVAGGKEPLLTETVATVSVVELTVLLLGGSEEPGATLELRLVAGGTERVCELSDGAVSDDGGSDDWDEGVPDIEDEDGPDETPGDEGSPTDEDGGAPEGEDDCPDEIELPGGPLEGEGPAVLLVVSKRDEGIPLSVVAAYDGLGGTEMITTELEAPEDEAERDTVTEELDMGAEFGGGKLPSIVVVLAPFEMPGFDELGMLLIVADEALPSPVDELSLSLIPVEAELMVSVSALVVVRVKVREVNLSVDMVAIKLLLIVVGEVDGKLPLFDFEDDTAAEFEDELRVKVDTIVMVRSVTCVVD